jgi:hypothetical protein
VPRDPEADEGPRRFIRNWLRFDDHAPRRGRTMWKLLATVAALLAACGLLAWFSGHLQR